MEDGLTELEEQYELELMSNYITYMSQLIASNIRTIYKYYENDYPLSLNNIIKISKDDYRFDNREKNLFYTLIKGYLKDKYKIEIVSKDEDKLKVEKV